MTRIALYDFRIMSPPNLNPFVNILIISNTYRSRRVFWRQHKSMKFSG